MSARVLHSVEIRGKESTWCIHTYITRDTASAWRADGLTVHEIENTIPDWLVGWFPLRVWCFLQDVFNFRNPFR